MQRGKPYNSEGFKVGIARKAKNCLLPQGFRWGRAGLPEAMGCLIAPPKFHAEKAKQMQTLVLLLVEGSFLGYTKRQRAGLGVQGKPHGTPLLFPNGKMLA